MHLPLQNNFLRTLLLLVVLNLAVKPVWILAIDRQVQNVTGFASYGAYYAMVSFCFLFSMVLDPGLHVRLSRDAASASGRLSDLFAEAIRMKLLLILCFWVLLLSAAYTTGVRDWPTLVSVSLMFTCASFLSMVRHFMSGAQLFRQDAWLSVVDKTMVILIIGTLLLYPHNSPRVTIGIFVWVQMAALLASITLGLWMVTNKVGPIRFKLSGRVDPTAFRSGFPFAVNSFLMGMVYWPDGFLLERLHPSGAEEAGMFAAGYRLLDAFGMLGSIVGGFLLSYITGAWSSKGDFLPAFTASRKVLMLAAVLLSTCIWACPSYFADLLYHRTEAPLVSVMGTLMLGLPALYIVHMQGTLLTATGHIYTFIRTSLAAALLSVLLKVALLPAFGAQASAWVCICVYWAYAIALVQGTRRRLSSGIEWTEVLLYAMSALGCYGILRLLLFFEWNPLFAVTFACVTSALFFAGVGGVKFKEIWELLKGK